MGVILNHVKTVNIVSSLLPRYGGYSWVMADHLIELTVVSPLWGLFYLTKKYCILNASRFPVTGVILLNLTMST